jgi:hypothetical protein
MQNVVYCNHARMRSSAGKATQSRRAQQCAAVKATVGCELWAVFARPVIRRVRGEVCMLLSRRHASECVRVRIIESEFHAVRSYS